LYLESGEIKPAIDAYNQALAICEESSEAAFDSHDDHSQSHNSIIMKQQEGLVLLLRASAFLQQARFHKEALQKAIGGDEMKLPTPELLKCVLSEAISPSSPPSSVDASLSKESVEEDTDQNGDTKSKSDGTDGEELSADLPSEEGNTTLVTSTEENDEASSQCVSSPAADTGESKDRKNDPQTAVRLSVLRMLKTNGNLRQVQLEKIKYRHGLYQTSLLQATRDSLRATEALPSYPTAWLRAGELLSDLWKIKESKQYYERAVSIDGSLEESIGPLLEGLERRQELVELARTKKEWPEDSLQLALDITE
jgi:tetratricopeptide (TPR) repeat protein